ncbi:hypothetical protein GUITHDRAFT_149221 [Guillardia theta CCMP2712]|uniref:Methyltransferase small domain-containing protein n=1 Tax=Guillardia theta (strain CCMP2712) TaxID=905079 RepID=L1I5M4_GUITC|nr:hypothetical protein GUITHDRAFT_149221 [Guillardia theta CCMP2712]EKX31563.1 hypothetical protein GUITHDRAFT_149221 [Guillardia theta CCMP2712]|eukprot:XP_005818543.1 hypothetical protein GUITHDRAFT_149221 [Guillardia theta CCMP2712]
MAWERDIQIESDAWRGRPLTTTGGRVWDAAHRMADFLEAMQEELGLSRPGMQILELGAGCGWLGMTIARSHPGARVCLTEMEHGGALEHLQHNVQLNQKDGKLGNVETCACDWSHWVVSGEGEDEKGKRSEMAPLLETRWDLIIGSDLVYNEIGVQWLPKVLKGLLGKGTIALYSHTKHRLDMADQEFFAELTANELIFTEVHEPGVPSPPPSPPFFESLFPDMRIAILRIERCQDDVKLPKFEMPKLAGAA